MDKKGFTLLELLVVVLLIGILGAIALPQYFNVLERQRAMEAIGIMSAVEKAQVRYYAINDQYTADFSNLDFDLRSNIDISGDNVTGDTFQTDYFTYRLRDDKIQAKRRLGNFMLITTFGSGEDKISDTCCSPSGDNKDKDICEIINIKECE